MAEITKEIKQSYNKIFKDVAQIKTAIETFATKAGIKMTVTEDGGLLSKTLTFNATGGEYAMRILENLITTGKSE